MSENIQKQKQLNLISSMKKYLADISFTVPKFKTKTDENESSKETFWSVCSSEQSDDRYLIKMMEPNQFNQKLTKITDQGKSKSYLKLTKSQSVR